MEDKSIDDIESLKAEMDKLRKLNEELIGEKRKASESAKAESERARNEVAEAAKAKGDFEALYKSSEESRSRLEAEMKSIRDRALRETVSRESLAIATSMADGVNAELLQEFISRRLTVTDDGVKVVDAKGNLTISSVDDLKKEFISSGRFNSLLRQSKAEGGGSTGEAVTNGSVKFSDMSEQERIRLYKSNPDEYRRLSGVK